MARRNLRTRLRTRPTRDPLAAYDAQPPELRRWLAGACLPWSARSARAIWDRWVRAGGVPAALAALDRAEARMLAREGRLTSRS
jgi:hypothetical protein